MVRITANHAVHRDDIGCRDIGGDGHNIAGDAANSVALFTSESLALRGLRKHRVRTPGHITAEKYW